MIRKPPSIASRGRRAFTLIEITFASAIALVALGALVSINMLAQRFLAEGYREASLLSQASLAIDSMTRTINGAYRLDAQDPANIYQIKDNYQTFEFSVPGGGGNAVRERYRYDAASKELRFERSAGGGAFAMIGNDPFLTHVSQFYVDNQEGIISLVVRLNLTLPRYGDKQYTLIGRALPRNL